MVAVFPGSAGVSPASEAPKMGALPGRRPRSTCGEQLREGVSLQNENCCLSLRCGKVYNESSAPWPARWAHAFGVRQPCWRLRYLLPGGRRRTASPIQSGSMAPALQGHVPLHPTADRSQSGNHDLSATEFRVETHKSHCFTL